MSREIKFKVWNPKEKEMSEPFNPFDSEDCGGTGWWWENCVLMQFTGLFDKHGKEIYEGDIVFLTCEEPPEGRYRIEWSELAFCGWEMVGLDDNTGDLLLQSSMELEVIGNIYESKHLAEGKVK